MTDDEDDVVETMRRAVAAVRHEWHKAAAVTAVLDGTLVALLASLLLTLSGVEAVSPAAIAVVVGVLGAGASLGYRLDKPAVERFETVNPAVHEALRTARDAIEDEQTSTMARALYADVIDRLQTTSSLGLLRLPRVAARFGLIFALSLAAIQLSIAGIDLGAAAPDPISGDGGGGAPAGSTPTPSGLQPGDDVLGTPENVTPGGENLSAEVGREAGPGDDSQQREYETGGFGDDGAVEAERTGYAPPDDIENAELIKEYNLRIREETDE